MDDDFEFDDDVFDGLDADKLAEIEAESLLKSQRPPQPPTADANVSLPAAMWPDPQIRPKGYMGRSQAKRMQQQRAQLPTHHTTQDQPTSQYRREYNTTFQAYQPPPRGQYQGYHGQPYEADEGFQRVNGYDLPGYDLPQPARAQTESNATAVPEAAIASAPGTSDYGDSLDAGDSAEMLALADSVAPDDYAQQQEYAGNGGEDGMGAYGQDESDGMDSGNLDMLGQEPVLLEDGHTKGIIPNHIEMPYNLEAIVQLQDENVQLREELDARMGEVSLVRAQYAQIQENSRKVLSRLNQERRNERTRGVQELEKKAKETQRLTTELEFLKNEAIEAKRRIANLESIRRTDERRASQLPEAPQGAKNPQAPTRETNAPPGWSQARAQRPQPTANKRSRTGLVSTVSDGFADNELIAGGSQHHLVTRVGAKRKRDVVTSGLPALPLSQPIALAQDEALPQGEAQPILFQEVSEDPLARIDFRLLEKLSLQDDREYLYEALKRHTVPDEGKTVLAQLSKFRLPNSQDDIAFELMDSMTSLRVSAAQGEFSSGIFRLLTSMLESCLTHTYFGPLHLILDLFRFAIGRAQGSALTELIPKILDVMQRIVDINSLRFWHKSHHEVDTAIDNSAFLVFLKEMAFVVKEGEANIKRYWRYIRSDFHMILLTLNQPIQHIKLCLSWIRTSVFLDTFGTIVRSGEEQLENQNTLLEVVTKLLVERPRVAAGNQPYKREQLLDIRTEACAFLTTVAAMHTKGKAIIIEHPTALPRLVKVVAQELDQLYQWRRGENEACARFINRAVRLVHSLCISDAFGCSNRIGGPMIRMHLVAMARLSYSNGIGQEAGLDPDIRDLAWEILSLSLPPDESESLERLFVISDEEQEESAVLEKYGSDIEMKNA